MPHINYLACVVAAVVAFVIGGLWYSPLLFAKAWTAAHGLTPEQTVAMRKSAPRAYGVSVVCFFVMAVVLSTLISSLGITTILAGAKLGALAWVGFAATIGLTANMYSRAPLALYLIDTAYQLVYMIVMGAIVAGWR
jgi:hypothetical protein